MLSNVKRKCRRFAQAWPEGAKVVLISSNLAEAKMCSPKDDAFSTILVCMIGAGTIGSAFDIPGTIAGMIIGASFGYWSSRRSNAKRR